MEGSGKGIPLPGVALMLDPQFAEAAFPLFASGEVEIVEWTFDLLWSETPAPDWLPDLLTEYASAERLLGHGVHYSMFTIDEQRATEWCARLAEECRTQRYRHISEHFGFMVAGEFHRGAPLPVPFTAELLELGKDRMRRLADAAGVPVGLENLAFAFGMEDVQRQGEFLATLISPVNGFLLLDLHNIYCQAANFNIAPEELLQAYPLESVAELHLSGGSWSEVEGQSIRRDTHDGPVPEELFDLLTHALKICPNVEAVIFEHLGDALPDEASHKQYRDDFRRISRTIHETCGTICQ